MVIYLVVFAISCLFTYLAQEMFKKQKKISGVIFSILAILFPAGLAGFRAPIVGTDVQVYGENYFNLACASNSFAQYQELCTTDFFYLVLNYIISRLTTNINIFFFILELLILTPIYISAYQHRKEKSMVMFMAIIYLLFFNRSINELRQAVAIAFIVLSIKYAEDRKLIKYSIIVAIAILFHISALMAIPMYVIFGTKEFKHKRLFEFVLILGTAMIIANLNKIIEIGISSGILSSRYSYYLGAFANTASDISVLDLIMRAFFVICGFLVYRKAYNKNKKIESFLLLMIMDFILAQSAMFALHIDRMALYYGIPAYANYIPMFPKGFKQDRFNKWTVQLISISVLLAYWCIKFAYLGNGETVPYISYILEIGV